MFNLKILSFYSGFILRNIQNDRYRYKINNTSVDRQIDTYIDRDQKH